MACTYTSPDGNKISPDQFLKEVTGGNISYTPDNSFMPTQEELVNNPQDSIKRIAENISKSSDSTVNLTSKVEKYLSNFYDASDISITDEVMPIVKDLKVEKFKGDVLSGEVRSSRTYKAANLTKEEIDSIDNFDYKAISTEKVRTLANKLVDKAFENNSVDSLIDDAKAAYSDTDSERGLGAVATYTLRQIELKLIEKAVKEDNQELFDEANKINTLIGKTASGIAMFNENPYYSALKVVSDNEAQTNALRDEILGTDSKKILKQTHSEIVKSTEDIISDYLQSQAFADKVAEEVAKSAKLSKVKAKAKSVKETETSYREERLKQFKKDQQQYLNASLPFLNQAGISLAIDLAKSYIREGVADFNVIKTKLNNDFGFKLSKREIEQIFNDSDIVDYAKTIKDKALQEQNPRVQLVLEKIQSVWSEYASEMAKKVAKTLDENTVKKVPALQQLSKVLYDNVSRKAKEKGEKIPTNPLDVIKDILNNLDGYREVLNQAYEQFKDNPTKLAEIENTIGAIFDKPVSPKLISQFLNHFLKNRELNTSKFLQLDGLEKESVINQLNSAIDYLVPNIANAQEVKNAIQQSINEHLQKTAKDLLDKKLEAFINKSKLKEKPLNNKVKYTYQQLLNLLSLGALNEDQFNTLIYNLLDIDHLNEADKALVLDLYNQIKTIGSTNVFSAPARQQLTTLVNDIKARRKSINQTNAVGKLFASQSIRKIANSVTQIMVLQLLAGLGTTTLNYLSTITKGSYLLATKELIKNDKQFDAKFKAKAIYKSLALLPLTIKNMAIIQTNIIKTLTTKEGAPIRAIAASILNDGFNLIDSDIEANRNISSFDKLNVNDKFEDFLKHPTKSTFRGAMWLTVKAARLMLATDALVRLSTQDYFMKANVYREYLAADDKDVNDALKIAEDVYNQYQDTLDDYIELAKEEADELNKKLQSEWKNVVSINKSAIYLRAVELLQQDKRFEQSINQTLYDTKYITEQHNPTGTLGLLYDAVLHKLGINPASGIFFRFIRPITNTVNYGIQNSVIGGFSAFFGRGAFISSFVSGDEKSKVTTREKLRVGEFESVEDHMRTYLWWVNSMWATASLWVIMSAFNNDDDDDEEDNFIKKVLPIDRISGNLYNKDYQANQTLQNNTNFEPYTISWNFNKWLPGNSDSPHLKFNMRYDWLPHGMTMAILGDHFDAVKYRGKNDDDKVEVAKDLFVTSLAFPFRKILQQPIKQINEYLDEQEASTGSKLLKNTVNLLKPAFPVLGSANTRDITRVLNYIGNFQQPTPANYKGPQVKAAIETLVKDTPLVWLNITGQEKAFDCIGNYIYPDKEKLPLNLMMNPIVAIVNQMREEQNNSEDKWIYDMLADGVNIAYRPSELTIQGQKVDILNPEEANEINIIYNKMIAESYKELLYLNKDLLVKKDVADKQELVDKLKTEAKEASQKVMETKYPEMRKEAKALKKADNKHKKEILKGVKLYINRTELANKYFK